MTAILELHGIESLLLPSRCETILENHEKVNRDVGHILAVNIR